MYFVQGRPRFWIPGFDTAHLAAPALLAVVILLLRFLPDRPVTRSRPIPPAAARILPTAILAPTTGAVVPAGQSAIVEGLAQPGGTVRLYWYDKPLGEPTRVGPDGRWQFTIANLPPGTHQLRASALVAGRYEWSGEVVFTVPAPASKPLVTPAPKPGPTKQTPSRTRKPASKRP